MRIKKVISVVLSTAFALSLFALPTLATGRSTVYIPKDKQWVTAGSDTRSSDYKHVETAAWSVSPAGNQGDNYHIVWARAKNGTQVVTDSYQVDERDTSNTIMTLYGGCNGMRTFDFQFRGNKPSLDAYADVSYLATPHNSNTP